MCPSLVISGVASYKELDSTSKASFSAVELFARRTIPVGGLAKYTILWIEKGKKYNPNKPQDTLHVTLDEYRVLFLLSLTILESLACCHLAPWASEDSHALRVGPRESRLGFISSEKAVGIAMSP